MEKAKGKMINEDGSPIAAHFILPFAFCLLHYLRVSVPPW